MEKVIFLIFLILAVFQDIQNRSLERNFLIMAGGAGLAAAVLTGREAGTTILSAAVGILLLVLSSVTNGGIGEGDGWFFVITGFFLEPLENCILFLSGLAFSSVYSLAYVTAIFIGGGRVHGQKLPFLPFLVPLGLWLPFSG